jgi:hypothetical protein
MPKADVRIEPLAEDQRSARPASLSHPRWVTAITIMRPADSSPVSLLARAERNDRVSEPFGWLDASISAALT